MFKEVKKLIRKRTKTNILNLPKKKSVYYEVNISFATFFQVWYYDGDQRSIIREFYGDHFLLETTLFPSAKNIVLKAYINNPLKKSNEQVRMSIQVQENVPVEKIFDINTDVAFKNAWYTFSIDL